MGALSTSQFIAIFAFRFGVILVFWAGKLGGKEAEEASADTGEMKDE